MLGVTPTGMLLAKPHSSSVWEIVQNPFCTGTKDISFILLHN